MVTDLRTTVVRRDPKRSIVVRLCQPDVRQWGTPSNKPRVFLSLICIMGTRKTYLPRLVNYKYQGHQISHQHTCCLEVTPLCQEFEEMLQGKLSTSFAL